MFVSVLVIGCATPLSGFVVQDETTAIRIGMDACVSKRVVQPEPSSLHAKLNNSVWHVWEAAKKCEVFSTDVDARTASAGPCSVCVT
ncbi:MAG TPA: hypothetical protein VHW02_11250 [Rhizomicrobium sp.]|nr:hypothetical protein [Rhizomicrobium sp.]